MDPQVLAIAVSGTQRIPVLWSALGEWEEVADVSKCQLRHTVIEADERPASRVGGTAAQCRLLSTVLRLLRGARYEAAEWDGCIVEPINGPSLIQIPTAQCCVDCVADDRFRVGESFVSCGT